MSALPNFLASVKAAAAATGVDMNQAKTSTGREPLPEGVAFVRMVGYIELGKHAGEYKGKAKKNDKVAILFEVSGKNYPPREHDGVMYPNILSVKINKSLSDKAVFFKLFRLLNWHGKALHMADLLGEAWRCKIRHEKGRTDPTKVFESLKDAAGNWTIQPAVTDVTDPDTGEPTGETRPIAVKDPVSQYRAFLWDNPSLEQWGSIFIEGEYEERRDDSGKVTKPKATKNVYQAEIVKAMNFAGSPIEELLKEGGVNLDFAALAAVEEEGDTDDDDAPAAPVAAPAAKPAAVVPQGGAATDALAGILG